ncbi:MAG: IS200/IS605 family transposase [Elainellaceae cyanobacterium]
MRSPYTTLYVHCVWSTWNRLPLLTAAIRPILYGAIAKECEALNCSAIAIGGSEDQIHVLMRYPPTLSISELMKQVKNSSSQLINHELQPDTFFKWQSSYNAFSVSDTTLDSMVSYILSQERHPQEHELQTQGTPSHINIDSSASGQT